MFGLFKSNAQKKYEIYNELEKTLNEKLQAYNTQKKQLIKFAPGGTFDIYVALNGKNYYSCGQIIDVIDTAVNKSKQQYYELMDYIEDGETKLKQKINEVKREKQRYKKIYDEEKNNSKN